MAAFSLLFSQTPGGESGKIPKLHLWSKSLVAQSKVLDPSLFFIQRPQDVLELSVSSSYLCLCKEKRFLIVLPSEVYLVVCEVRVSPEKNIKLGNFHLRIYRLL